MSLTRCPMGHMYNARRYGKICPYCNMKVQEESAATKPLGFEPPVELLQEEIRPVCGWLVCIEGARVGMDYKIHDGKNFVGRGDEYRDTSGRRSRTGLLKRRGGLRSYRIKAI